MPVLSKIFRENMDQIFSLNIQQSGNIREIDKQIVININFDNGIK